ncbi:MAG TPA: 50S ribosomal protein L11 methyltransferase [Candidatus Caenarcaniphilales bacterium]
MGNSWWQIQILGDPALEELIVWRLQDFGCGGAASQLQERSCLIQTYLPHDQFQQTDLEALALLLQQDAAGVDFASPTAEWHEIDEEDWANSWKDHWHPQEIGDRLLINPAWLPLPETTDRIVLQLNPGVAFGTGTHATTQLCLVALEQQLNNNAAVKEQVTIADIGCGSGILSIAAILLGAHKAYALDLDPLAVDSARGSRMLNRLGPSQMVVEQGSIEQLQELLERPIDGIVCNILADVIINLVPQMSAISHASTWGILSGILLTQVQPVTATLAQHGWSVFASQRQQDWCCLNIRRR